MVVVPWSLPTLRYPKETKLGASHTLPRYTPPQHTQNTEVYPSASHLLVSFHTNTIQDVSGGSVEAVTIQVSPNPLVYCRTYINLVVFFMLIPMGPNSAADLGHRWSRHLSAFSIHDMKWRRKKRLGNKIDPSHPFLQNLHISNRILYYLSN